MPQQNAESKQKPHLVQSKLTDNFGAIKISSTKSPCFSDSKAQNGEKEAQAAGSKDAKLDLYPSRRANLKTRPPTLPSSKRSVLLAA